jgi:hypothetical protein
MSRRFRLLRVAVIGLVPLCESAMASQASDLTGLSHSAEFAWLLGALVLGFSVVARRAPRHHGNGDRPSAVDKHNLGDKSESWAPSSAGG